MTVTLDGASLTIDKVTRIAEKGEKAAIAKSSLRRMDRFRKLLDEKTSSGEVIYGVNTGFGSLSDKVVPKKDARKLQLNLVRSHTIGVGEPMPDDVVRAAMVIRLNSLLRGNSAVRPAVAELIVGMLNANVTPIVPSFGSLGASGDLVPSAHLALTMVGEGKARRKGKVLNSRAALRSARLRPLELDSKEGLSLINGTQFTTAFACLVVHRAGLLLRTANGAVALTSEVLEACAESFDKRLVGLRKVGGQQEVAGEITTMLKGSRRIRKQPVPQDPYSIRCAPQVHGSTWEALRFARSLVEAELNSVTDNPVLTSEGDILHGGNFHAQPIAMALDLLSVAVAYLGGISLARTHLLLSRSPSSRKFLAAEPGLQSGLMIAEYTASALAGENAKEVYPLSTYPANVSAGIEDHASYGVNCGLKAAKVVANVARILAIELVCGSNYSKPFDGELSPSGRRTCRFVRETSPPLTGDRPLSDEIETLAARLLKTPVS